MRTESPRRVDALKLMRMTFLVCASLILLSPIAHAFQTGTLVFAPPDSVQSAADEEYEQRSDFRNAWGLDVLISNDGFGLGTFYRREFTQDLFGFVSLSISEAKDDREVEFTDFFGNTFVPGTRSASSAVNVMHSAMRLLERSPANLLPPAPSGSTHVASNATSG